MAKTYPKLALSILNPQDPVLGFVEDQLPEGASQTFPAGVPLINGSAGNVGTVIVDGTSPITGAIVAWALTAGQNNAVAGAVYTKVAYAYVNINVEANVMGATGASPANYTLLATDLLALGDLSTGSNYPATGGNGWYITTTSPSQNKIRISSFMNTYKFPTGTDISALAGDINARVQFRLIPGASIWY
jgi:hypothetical protein